MCHRYSTIFTRIAENSVNTVKGTVVFLSFKVQNHLVNKVINIEQFKSHASIIDLDKQIICYIITEGRNIVVIVGSTPLAKEIWNAVSKHQLFTRFFALTIFAVICANASSLKGRRNHYRATVFLLFKRVKQYFIYINIIFLDFIMFYLYRHEYFLCFAGVFPTK